MILQFLNIEGEEAAGHSLTTNVMYERGNYLYNVVQDTHGYHNCCNMNNLEAFK